MRLMVSKAGFVKYLPHTATNEWADVSPVHKTCHIRSFSTQLKDNIEIITFRMINTQPLWYSPSFESHLTNSGLRAWLKTNFYHCTTLFFIENNQSWNSKYITFAETNCLRTLPHPLLDYLEKFFWHNSELVLNSWLSTFRACNLNFPASQDNEAFCLASHNVIIKLQKHEIGNETNSTYNLHNTLFMQKLLISA